MKKASLLVIGILLASLINVATFAACPSSDLSGDCKVNFDDFALMASEWVTTYDANDLADMAFEWLTEGTFDKVWIPISGAGFTGEMSKYETTNAQYCEFLNAALTSGDITVGVDDIVYGADGSNSGEDFVGEKYFDTYEASSYSQITFNGSTFSVRSRDGYDMSNHPVVMVSWYGATAFCNYYGYRLPTEWEWQAVADYDGSYTYGCGKTIDQSKATYDYNNPLSLSTSPYTSPVNHYSSYGYGMNDMAGNVWEWTSTVFGSNSYRVIRGGSWVTIDADCTVSSKHYHNPNDSTFDDLGFRVCR